MARPGKGGQWIRTLCLLAAAVLIASVTVCAQSNPAPQQPNDKPSESEKAKEPAATPEPKAEQAASLPTAAPEHEMTREEQIASQTRELYRLSAELRAEVAKTYKDSLSLVVLKKAEQIEKLSKSLKALMDADIADNKHK